MTVLREIMRRWAFAERNSEMIEQVSVEILDPIEATPSNWNFLDRRLKSGSRVDNFSDSVSGRPANATNSVCPFSSSIKIWKFSWETKCDSTFV